MKPELALAVLLAGMSDRDVLAVYQAAAKDKDPRTRQIGRELLMRFHRANPTHFPQSVLEAYDAQEDT